MIVSPTGFRASSQNPFTPTPTTNSNTQVIESDSSMVVREGSWQSQSVASASGGSYLYSSRNEQDVLILPFQSTTIEIIYVAGPNLGTLALEVDDTVLRTVITAAEQTTYHQSAVINYLTDEPHTLRVYAQEGGIVALDAFVVVSVDDIGGIQSSRRLPPSNAYEIAYQCDGNDICLINPQGQSQLQITNSEGFLAPEWSPDGRRILYHRNWGQGLSGLGILEPDPNNPTGYWIDRGIFATTLEGINNSLSPRKSWSSDGKKILYAANDHLYYIDLEQCPNVYQENSLNPESPPPCESHLIEIDPDNTGGPNLCCYRDPSWSPDSTHFVFVYWLGLTDAVATGRLVTGESPTVAEVDTISDPDVPFGSNFNNPSWSPNGSRIITSHTYQSHQRIQTLVGSSGVIANSGSDNAAAWSPDGNQIVFRSRVDDIDTLHIVSALGGTATPLTPGHWPSWKRTTICTIPVPEGSDGVKYYRAPITYNPHEGDLPFYSSTYQFELDAYFIDNRDVAWYRVARILDSNGQPPTGNNPQADAARKVEDKGGVWVVGSTEVDWPECNGINTTPPPTMRYAHEYDIPDIDWESFTQFTLANNVPVSYTALCNGVEPFSLGLEIHALGYEAPGGADYPLSRGHPEGGIHHGVDFFVEEDVSVEARSVGSNDGIVVGIGTGTETKSEPESHILLGIYGVGSNPSPDVDESWYSVVVRYGHLYVLYGHLSSISDNIWVGAIVRPSDFIGIIGEQGGSGELSAEKHLHLEVFSYEVYPSDMYSDPLSTGILPYGTKSFEETDLRQVYHYDFMQLVNNSTITDAIETASPSLLAPPPPERFIDQRIAALNFAGCSIGSINYHTRVPDPDPNEEPNDRRMRQVSDGPYRGFHYYDEGINPPSPLLVPVNHP